MAEPARKLDPSEDDYEHTFNRTNLQALEGGGEGGGPSSRGKLQSVPTGSDVVSPKDLEKAEKASAPWSYNNNNDSYASTGATPRERLQAVARGAKSKKGILSGLGIGGGLVGILISFSFMLPLKIVGLIDSVVHMGEQRVEHVVEVRAERILARAILGNASGVVPINGGPLQTLIASVRTTNFEKRLAAKGLKIIDPKDGSGVKLIQNGKTLGGSKGFKDPNEIMDALKAGGNVDNSVLKLLVKEDIPTIRFLKRAKFAKFLRVKYHISRFGIKEETDPNRANLPPGERAIADAETTNSSRLINGAGEQATEAADALAELAGDTPTGTSTASSSLIDELKKLSPSALKDKLAEEIAKQLNKVLVEKVAAETVKTLAKRAGYVGLAYGLDAGLTSASQNQTFTTLPSKYKAAQYAKLFAAWIGYKDQIQAGRMSGEMVGQLANQLDGIKGATGDVSSPLGAEGSQTFNYINGYADQGVAIPENQKINEDGAGGTLVALQAIANGYTNSVGKVLHPILSLLKPIFDKIGDISALILKATGAADAVQSVLQPLLGIIVNFMGFNVANPASNGATLYNAIGSGSTSLDTYCKEALGCRKLTEQQASAENQTIALNDKAYSDSKGIAYNIFSTDNTKSLVSQLAINLPTSTASNQVANTVTSGLAIIGSIPHSVGALLSGKASAATPDYSYKNIYNTVPYGALSSDLAQPVSDAAMAGTCTPIDTKTVDGSTFDSCIADQTIAQSMVCAIDNSIDGDCSGIPESSPSNTSGTTPGSTIPTGTAKELAQKILDNANITFQTAVERAAMQTIAQTGKGTTCGSPVVSPNLLGVLLAIADKYKVVVGVLVDGHNCNGGFHPKGSAADLNGINPLTGGGGTGNFISPGDYSSNQALLTQAYVDIAKIISGGGGGGMGQIQCFGSPPSLAGISGVNVFNDSCNHLHIDVGGR